MPATVTKAKKPVAKLSVVATPKPASAKPKKPAVKAKATVAKAPVRRGKSKNTAVPEQQRRHYVEVAAYYIAERRGFQGGCELEDWIQAEIEVDRLLRESLINS